MKKRTPSPFAQPFLPHLLLSMLVTCALSLWQIGCGSPVTEPADSDCGTLLADEPEAITYTSHIKNIMDTHCTTCHASDASNRQSAPISINFDTYADTSNNATSANTRMNNESNPMPPTTASTTPTTKQLCLLSAWIEQDMPE